MNDPKQEMFNKAKTIMGATPEIDAVFPDAQHEDYELEVWMSTDGKHTVRGKATTPEGKKLMYGAVVSIFEQIKGRYGTKQQQNVEAYDGKKAELAPEGNCPKCGAPMKISSKGKPYCSKLCWKK